MEKFEFDVIDGGKADWNDVKALAELAKEAIIGGFGVQIKNSIKNQSNSIVIETTNDYLLLNFIQKEYDSNMTLEELHNVHKIKEIEEILPIPQG